MAESYPEQHRRCAQGNMPSEESRTAEERVAMSLMGEPEQAGPLRALSATTGAVADPRSFDSAEQPEAASPDPVRGMEPPGGFQCGGFFESFRLSYLNVTQSRCNVRRSREVVWQRLTLKDRLSTGNGRQRT